MMVIGRIKARDNRTVESVRPFDETHALRAG
jgi:hypothetical protein